MFNIQSLWAHKQSTSPNLIKHLIYFNNLVAKLLEKDAIISKHLCNVQSIWLHKCRCLLCAIYRQPAYPWWLIEWTRLEKHQDVCFIFYRIYCLYIWTCGNGVTSDSFLHFSVEMICRVRFLQGLEMWLWHCSRGKLFYNLHLIVSRLSLLPWPSRLLAAGLSMALASPCLFSQPSN